MGNFRRNKKGFLASLIVVELVFVICIYWIVALYINLQNRDAQFIQADIIAHTTKTVYEEERTVLNELEPVIDESIKSLLFEVSKDAKSRKAIDSAYLKELAETKPVTGIWIIESDGIVKLSSDGRLLDAKDWYKDHPEVNWSGELNKLLNQEGYYWIAPYSKMVSPPYTYYKWGYIGLGEVPGIGKAVLEVGISVEDIKNYDSDLLKRVMNNPDNPSVKSIDITYSDPSMKDYADSKNFKAKRYYQDGTVVNQIIVNDFNGHKSQMKIVTEFPELKSQSRVAIIVAALCTIFTLGLFVLVSKTARTRNRSQE